MKYEISETFFSLKGEGVWTGFPMYFIRLAGCNLNCSFCDTDSSVKRVVDDEEILAELKQYSPTRVVITGGEPLIHPEVPHLVNLIKHYGASVHLETNGSIKAALLYQIFDWVAVSPKNLNVSDLALKYANEVKVPWSWDNISLAIDIAPQLKGIPFRYLLPIAKNFEKGDRTKHDFIDENVQSAIRFCLVHPKLRYGVCHQLHKCFNIK